MQRWHDLVQLIIQVLRDPAWSGIGGICTLVGIPLSISLARRSQSQRLTTSRCSFKKIINDDVSLQIVDMAVGISSYSLPTSSLF